MAKGSIAKELIVKKLAKDFGDNFIGEFDKKVYLWSEENGEKIQIAISMTCPKIPIQVDAKVPTKMNGEIDFTGGNIETTRAVQEAPPAEITDEEKDNIEKLMRKLDLI